MLSVWNPVWVFHIQDISMWTLQIIGSHTCLVTTIIMDQCRSKLLSPRKTGTLSIVLTVFHRAWHMALLKKHLLNRLIMCWYEIKMIKYTFISYIVFPKDFNDFYRFFPQRLRDCIQCWNSSQEASLSGALWLGLVYKLKFKLLYPLCVWSDH